MTGTGIKDDVETANAAVAEGGAAPEGGIAERIEAADVAASVAAGRHRHRPAVRALGFLSEVADQPPAFTLAALASVAGAATRRPQLAEAGLRMLAALTVATVAKSALKSRLVRTRPNVLLEEGRYETGVDGPDEGPWNSFPSGHTANAFAAARAITRVAPGTELPALAGAAAIGAMQVPRGAHHPLDVFAGAALGLAAEALVHALWPREARGRRVVARAELARRAVRRHGAEAR